MLKRKMLVAMMFCLIGTSTYAKDGSQHCFWANEILKVVDGDTIYVRVKLHPFHLLKDLRVRMEGINAWESRTRDPEEKKLGLAAKERLTELVGDGSELLVCLSGQGKFGRWLGTLYVGGTNINTQLVVEGHAHEYLGGKRKEFNEN